MVWQPGTPKYKYIQYEKTKQKKKTENYVHMTYKKWYK